MSTGRQRVVARQLQRQAAAMPLDRAIRDMRPGGPEMAFFERVDRQLTWGLTLNK